MRIRPVGAHALLLEVDDPAGGGVARRAVAPPRAAGELSAVEIVPGGPHRAARRRCPTRAAAAADRCAPGARAGRPTPRRRRLVEVPVALRRARPRRRRRALGRRPCRRWSTGSTGDRVRGRVLRLRARLRLPDRAAGRARRCPGWPRPGPGCRPARSRWPAPYAGIYPTASPGGWRLVGRTDADAVRPRPPTRRRCSPRAPGSGSWPRDRPMIEVLRAGPLTTVQDLGRPGCAHLGVPRSGALDAPALRLANRLVGNPDERGRPGDHPDRRARCAPSRAATVARHRRAGAGDGRRPRRSPSARRSRVPAGRRCRDRPGRARACAPTSPSPAASRSRRCSAAGPPTPSPGSARRRCAPATVLPLGDRRRPPAPAGRPCGRRRTRDGAAIAARAARARATTGSPRPRCDAAARQRVHASARRATGSARGWPAGADPRGGRRAAQRGHRARRGAGAGGRAAAGLPRRPPDHRRLPGRSAWSTDADLPLLAQARPGTTVQSFHGPQR